MKKNYKSILLLVSLFSLLVQYFLHSNFIVKEITSYTIFFFKNVFPTSFIFLLISYLLIENNLFYYIHPIIKNKGFYFFLIALISGYPTGAIYLKEAFQKEEITEKEANQYIQFSHFPNPLFVIYHCKNLFKNTLISIIFYLIIIFSNFILFLTTNKNHSKSKNSMKQKSSFTISFQKSLSQTFSTLLIIYGTSIFFYLLSQIIIKSFSFSPYLYVWICGIFDLTNGIMRSSIISNQVIQGIFLYFFIVFGSIPIHLQIKSILSDTSISYRSFFNGRAISFLLCSSLWILMIFILIDNGITVLISR